MFKDAEHLGFNKPLLISISNREKFQVYMKRVTGDIHQSGDLFVQLAQVNIILVGSIFCPRLFSLAQYCAPQKNLPTTNLS